MGITLRLSDLKNIAHAIGANLIALISPRTFIKLSRQTGRGEENNGISDVVEYFWRCFYEYFEVIGVSKENITGYLQGKKVLEYGPGDIPGTGLLIYSHGAEKVFCIDRYPMLSFSEKNLRIIDLLLSSLPRDMKERAESTFRARGNKVLGLNDSGLVYAVKKHGLAKLDSEVDLALSRAVLEHVGNLQETIIDMRNALRPSALGVHLVDLRSHGLHRTNPLDFLTQPTALWNLMHSNKGYPNRWRVNHYRKFLAEAGLEILMMRQTRQASVHDAREVQPKLAARFRNISLEDLRCLGFWLVCRRPA